MSDQQTLKLALFQPELYWEDKAANLASLEEEIWDMDDTPDIILLPEMFTTGFTMDPAPLAEPMNLHTFKWMRQMALQTKAAVGGSFIAMEDGHFFNRFLWMQPDGRFYFYDKRHLFTMAGEHERYSAGNRRLILSWKGWKICPMICYDLRFPVWSRNLGLAYDLLLFVANWPAPRISAWDALLRARAIENSAYCVGVNRVGTDGNGVAYNGHSQAYGPKGDAYLPPLEKVGVFFVALDKGELQTYRSRFPVHKDADNISIE